VIGEISGQIKVYDENFAFQKSIQAHSSTVLRIKQLPNGYVATCGDTTVKIWDPSLYKWTLIQTYTYNYSSFNAFDYINKDLMISAGMKNYNYVSNELNIWSISSGETVRTINFIDSVYTLKMLANGINLAIGHNGLISVYNINTGSLVFTLSQYYYNKDIIRINNGLYASSVSSQIYIWSSVTKTNKFVLNAHNDYVYGLKRISNDIIASGSSDATIKLWNITDGSLIRTLTNHTASIFQSIDLINDGQTLLSASYDGTIRFWDWKKGQEVAGIYTGLNIYSLASLDPIDSITFYLFSYSVKYSTFKFVFPPF
jgi:WD40 repeat protein